MSVATMLTSVLNLSLFMFYIFEFDEIPWYKKMGLMISFIILCVASTYDIVADADEEQQQRDSRRNVIHPDIPTVVDVSDDSPEVQVV